MKKIDWQRRASRLFCAVSYTLIAYAGIKYLLPAVLPLAVAFVVSWAVSSLSKRINRATGFPRRLCAFLIITLLFGGLSALLFFCCRQLIGEARRMADAISVGGELSSVLENLQSIPALRRIVESGGELADSLSPIVTRLLGMLVSYLGTFLGGVLRATPSALIGALMSVLFIYYASADGERIVGELVSLLPREAREGLAKIKDTAVNIGLRYVRAYGLIFLITFSEILVGLLILCPAYSLLGALFIAAVDILPVFGAGVVLIPWGIISLLSGEMLRGVGLLVLYVIVTVVRQIIEPHILGESMGVHPLLTVTGMFLGYRLFGVTGMIIAPIAVGVGLGAVKKVQNDTVREK